MRHERDTAAAALAKTSIERSALLVLSGSSGVLDVTTAAVNERTAFRCRRGGKPRVATARAASSIARPLVAAYLSDRVPVVVVEWSTTIDCCAYVADT